jgi:putative toxin-antitoxin system antitoxin component (TIGR02293 family)
MELTVSKVLGLPEKPEEDSWVYWVALARQGLPKTALFHLARYLHLSLADIAAVLPISYRTLHRYPEHKKLSGHLSGHVIALAQVYVRVVEVFEDDEKARRWLLQPCRALGGGSPILVIGFSAGDSGSTRRAWAH